MLEKGGFETFGRMTSRTILFELAFVIITMAIGALGCDRLCESPDLPQPGTLQFPICGIFAVNRCMHPDQGIRRCCMIELQAGWCVAVLTLRRADEMRIRMTGNAPRIDRFVMRCACFWVDFVTGVASHFRMHIIKRISRFGMIKAGSDHFEARDGVARLAFGAELPLMWIFMARSAIGAQRMIGLPLRSRPEIWLSPSCGNRRMRPLHAFVPAENCCDQVTRRA